MDNRTGIRAALARNGVEPDEDDGVEVIGHAYYAAMARSALGLPAPADQPILLPEPPPVAAPAAPRRVHRAPPPVLHAVIGCGVAAAAVLTRPDMIGLRAGAGCDAALAAIAALALVQYDRLAGTPWRVAVEATALPVASILALAVVLAGTGDVRADGAGVAVCALIVGGSPLLSAVRRGGRGRPTVRVLRELLGVAVLAPVLLAAASPALPLWARVGLAAAGGSLAAYDAVCCDLSGGLHAVAASVGVVLVLSAAVASGAGTGFQTVGAAALLLAWHGARGLFGHALAGQLARSVLVEYGAFVIVAAAALGLAGTAR